MTTAYFDHDDCDDLEHCCDVVITTTSSDEAEYDLLITVHNGGNCKVSVCLTLWYFDPCPPPMNKYRSKPLIAVNNYGVGNGTQTTNDFEVPALGTTTVRVGWTPDPDVYNSASVFVQLTDTSESNTPDFDTDSDYNAQQAVACAAANPAGAPAAYEVVRSPSRRRAS